MAGDKTGPIIFAIIFGLLTVVFGCLGGISLGTAVPISKWPQGVAIFPENGDKFITHYQQWTSWHWVEVNVNVNVVINNVSIPTVMTYPPDPRKLNTVQRGDIQTWICHARGAELSPVYVNVPMENGAPKPEPGVVYSSQSEIMSYSGPIVEIVVAFVFLVATIWCLAIAFDCC